MDKKPDPSLNDPLCDQEQLWAMTGRMSAELVHEVKAPLAAMRAQMQLMERRLQKGETVPPESLSPVLQQLDHMNDLVSAFLDLSSRRPLRVQPVNVAELCELTLELLRALFLRAGATCELKLAPLPDHPHLTLYNLPELHTDPAKVRQILINLLSNALEAGADRIVVTLTPYSSAMILEVADNGPGLVGISAEQIFEPGLTTKPTGSGLGLPLSSRLAADLGGDLALTQTEQGCCFRLVLADLQEDGSDL